MQYEFDFDERALPRPKWPERIFFALFPDAETAVRAERFGQVFRREHRLAGQPLLTERLHISLHLIGDYKRVRGKFIYAARRAGDAVAMKPFEVTLSGVSTFASGRPNRYPLVLLGESEALRDLHRRLGVAIDSNGLRAADQFAPHMTLSYGPDTIRPREIEPIRFVVWEFCLIHNERWLGELGTYHLLERWPLVLPAMR
ncbi:MULTISPECIES: 2'-5' RNA ligase family protein [unclassified Beijerinckia]|uniref:2'-5' RNA ligase family protein n=1 Tax=unclassified Beijerinckia TaxID=2638183 RepID=UPI000894CD62|nr:MULTISPECIES: 2'-5' RNA ligase family protein [unclassified Beijerinckia]MDH7794939.1 2'-5' RNA ligase [Beijerinckia sp. GAS462]SEB81209.1 2'-5' RNA ligase [Beijerinckia sp. 28-YEA-48]